jgi:hypothetical protein
MGAKQSKLDKLHEIYTAELTRQLKEGGTDEDGYRIPPTAALLAVIGNFLNRSGVRPTPDSPAHARLVQLAESLPFKAEDEHKVN